MKTIKKIFFCIIFLLASVANADTSESFILEGGKEVFGYYQNDVPSKFEKVECDKYVFADKKFTAIKDGRYVVKANGNPVIFVENSCLFNFVGGTELFDGSQIEFYQPNDFNIEGNAVFVKSGEKYKRIYNQKLQLKNGQKFSVENGYLPSGFFDGENIVYENRD